MISTHVKSKFIGKRCLHTYVGYFLLPISVIIIFSGKTLSTKLLADELAKTPKIAATSTFKRDTLVITAVKNFPTSFAIEDFRQADILSYKIGYQHALANDWLMKVSGYYRLFRKRKDNSRLAMLTLKHEASHIWRLEHPFYFGWGWGWSYTWPAVDQRIPIKRDNFYFPEFGVFTKVSLIYQASQSFLVALHIDRWRGVNTRRLQGVEIGLGLGYGL
jgi:hypothetical protein